MTIPLTICTQPSSRMLACQKVCLTKEILFVAFYKESQAFCATENNYDYFTIKLGGEKPKNLIFIPRKAHFILIFFLLNDRLHQSNCICAPPPPTHHIYAL
mmetsp:Transcript_32700/g.47752  ORF Transcript_32700/g.47752 Transcript_32700/m.47752 type:complete len:101 (+) Transcript_32700:1451-1753(+)